VRLRSCLLAFAVLLSLTPPLRAHETGKVQVYATFLKDGTYKIEIPIDPEHLEAGESVETLTRSLEDGATVAFDGKPVRPRVEVVPDPEAPPGRKAVRFSGPIPGGARAFTWTNTAPVGTYPLVLKNEGEESSVWQWLEPGAASQPFSLADSVVPPTRGEVALQYLKLGFTHILPAGLDHVLFVLGLFLLSRRPRPLLLQVTAFTLAHTLTLGLSIYGVVSLPPRIVEPLIALSIVFVAVENVLSRELRPTRVALVFAFGLLHGLGFAGVLSELGLPRSEYLTALLSFNAGVEAGQLAVISLAFLFLALPFQSRSWYRQRVVVPASCLIAAVGLYWSVQRIFF
jgi:HupE / UreJ protein